MGGVSLVCKYVEVLSERDCTTHALFLVMREQIRRELTLCITKKEKKMENGEQKTVEIKFYKILMYILYLLGVIFIIKGFYYYFQDLDYNQDPLLFYEKKYVGGDAYNYIISASRSTAVLIKSLIWIVLGCFSILTGRTFTCKQ